MFAVILVGLVVFIGLAIDVGGMMLTRDQLQASSDAAALAGASRLYKGPTVVRTTTKDFAQKHQVLGNVVTEVDNSDIVIGNWNRTTRQFTPSNADRGNAVRVNAHSRNKPLMFGGLGGGQTFNGGSVAIAAIVPREIVFVVDASGSMNDDTERCWATAEINAAFGGHGTTMVSALLTDLFGSADTSSDTFLQDWITSQTYVNDIEHHPAGTPVGATVNYQVAGPQYAYSVLTMNEGPLTRISTPSQYRIDSGDSESTRKTKAYNWLREVFLPARLAANPAFSNTVYWERYIDYVLYPLNEDYPNPPSAPSEPPEPSPPGNYTGHCCTAPPPPPHHMHSHGSHSHGSHSHGSHHAPHSGTHGSHNSHSHGSHSHGSHSHGGHSHNAHSHGGHSHNAHSHHVPAHHSHHSHHVHHSHHHVPPHSGPNSSTTPRKEWFDEWKRGNMPTLAGRPSSESDLAAISLEVQAAIANAAIGPVGTIHPPHLSTHGFLRSANPPSTPSCPSGWTVNTSCVSEEIYEYNQNYSNYVAAWNHWKYVSHPAWIVAIKNHYSSILPNYMVDARCKGGLRGSPSRGRTGKRPPSQLLNVFNTVDRLADLTSAGFPTFAFNNPNRDLRPGASLTAPRAFLNSFGKATYSQFQLDHGRNQQPGDGRFVPLSMSSGSTPMRSESVGDPDTSYASVSFPPREMPMHAARRAVIRAILAVKKFNETLDVSTRDRVSIVSFDRYLPGTGEEPILVQPLTDNYDGAVNSVTTIQSVGDRGASTAIESGMIAAYNHLETASPVGARPFSHRIVVLLTDGVPNIVQSPSATIDAFISSSGVSGVFYGADQTWPGDRYWFNAPLMQAKKMRNKEWDVYAVSLGFGAKSDFLNRVAVMGGTDKYGSNLQAGGNPQTYEDELVRIFKLILDMPRVYLVD